MKKDNTDLVKKKSQLVSFGLATVMCAFWGNILAINSAVAATPKAPPEVEFDERMLFGTMGRREVSKFARGNPVVSGRYKIDLLVNGSWVRRVEVSIEPGVDAYTERMCMDKELLRSLTIDITRLAAAGTDKFNKILAAPPGHPPQCISLEEIVPEAESKVELAELRASISIPQLYVTKVPIGFTPKEAWEDGVSAATVNYSVGTYQTKTIGGVTSSNFGQLDGGASFGRWRFRHYGSYTSDNKAKLAYTPGSTYLYTDIPAIDGKMLIGSASIRGSDSISVPMKGVQLFSDDRMLPISLRGYSPVIRGQADSSARITIFQRGQMVYQTAVPPGSFEINDLYSDGYGGDYLVKISEADGRERSFTVTFFSTPNLMRKGGLKYNAAVGEYDSLGSKAGYRIAQFGGGYGLGDNLSINAGLFLSENYKSSSVGAVFGTPWGAWSVDLLNSVLTVNGQASRNGSSLRTAFATTIPWSLTNFNVASYQNSSRDFYSVNDALTGITSPYGAVVRDSGSQKEQLALSINQSLGGWGLFNLSASTTTYWFNNPTLTEFQLGWSKSVGLAMLNLSAARQMADGYETTRYTVNVNFPLGNRRSSAILQAGVQSDGDGRTQSNIGASGIVDEKGIVSYGVMLSADNNSNRTTSGNVNWNTSVGTLNASASSSGSTTAFSAGFRGGLVAHPEGILISPQLGETITIVKAKSAAGAEILGGLNSRINKHGFGVMPYATPYSVNRIEIDSHNMPMDVELISPSQTTVPKSGAVSMVTFETEKSKMLVISLEGPHKDAIPFGAPIYDERGMVVGNVAQGQKVQVRVSNETGKLYIDMADRPYKRLEIPYTVPQGTRSNVYQIASAPIPYDSSPVTLSRTENFANELVDPNWIRLIGTIRMKDGNPLASGANVSPIDDARPSIAVVGEGGRFVLRVSKNAKTLRASWGESMDQTCLIGIEASKTANATFICETNSKNQSLALK